MMNHLFCRLYLKEVMKDVVKHTTVEQRKASWTYLYEGFNNHGEFHGPDNFYWHGNACCRWEARAQGWLRWMIENVDGFEEGDN
jgi:hypothetical protein